MRCPVTRIYGNGFSLDDPIVDEYHDWRLRAIVMLLSYAVLITLGPSPAPELQASLSIA